MKVGSILSPQDVDKIRSRIKKITGFTADRKILEQCRMIQVTLNKADRQAERLYNKINKSII